MSERLKDGMPFKVYFSKEATKKLKEYYKLERSEAANDEPLFTTEEGRRLTAHLLSMRFRSAAREMGYSEDYLANPFRPKRFRHLFRTAGQNAEVNDDYIRVFMGHSGGSSKEYLEKNSGLLHREYVKLEPYVTVYDQKIATGRQLAEMSAKITAQEGAIAELSSSNVELRQFKNLVLDFMTATGEALKYYHSMIRQAEAGTNESEREAAILKLEEIRKRVEELKARRQSNES